MRLRHLLFGSSLALLIGGAAPAFAQDNLSGQQREYRASADKICKAGNARLLTAARSFELTTEVSASGAGSKQTKVAKPADVVRFVTTVATAEMTDQIAKLRLLVVPEDDQAAMKKLFSDADKALKLLKSKPGEVAYSDPFKSVVKQFKSLGFNDCAKNAKADPVAE